MTVDIKEHEGKFDPQRVKFMVYGESGIGKTRLASTWPDPVFLDADKGMASVDRKVGVIEINQWGDMFDAYDYLRAGAHKFKTVVLDSLNEIQILCMDSVITKYPNVRRSYDDLPGLSDYGKMLDIFDKAMRAFKGLPLNVIFIAQVTNPYDDREMIRPQLIGKNAARSISRMADIIGYIYKADQGSADKLVAISFDSSEFVTKDRSGRLPSILQSPNYEKMLAYWKTDPVKQNKGE